MAATDAGCHRGDPANLSSVDSFKNSEPPLEYVLSYPRRRRPSISITCPRFREGLITMTRCVVVILLALLLPGCQSKASSPAQAAVPARKPEHAALVALTAPTPAQEAQLLLWQECQDRYYTQMGIDQTTCTFRPGEVIPIQCKWSFDESCSQVGLEFKWDARMVADHEIDRAIELVLGDMRFIQSSIPQLLSIIRVARDDLKARQRESKEPVLGTTQARIAPPNSSAVFFVHCDCEQDNSLRVDMHTTLPRSDAN